MKQMTVSKARETMRLMVLNEKTRPRRLNPVELRALDVLVRATK